MLLNLLARPGSRRSPYACRRAVAAAGWAVRVAGGAGRRADRWGGGAVNAGAAVMGTSVPIAAPPNHQATPRKGPVLAIRVIPDAGPVNPVDARAGDGRPPRAHADLTPTSDGQIGKARDAADMQEPVDPAAGQVSRLIGVSREQRVGRRRAPREDTQVKALAVADAQVLQ